MKDKNATLSSRTKKLWQFFTTYEKCWFFSILILSVIFAFLFPEEDVNGVNGKWIMVLYLLDIFFNRRLLQICTGRELIVTRRFKLIKMLDAIHGHFKPVSLVFKKSDFYRLPGNINNFGKS